MPFHIQVGCKDCADGPGDRIVVTESPTFPIYGAGIHTTSALDAFKGIAEIDTTELTASSGVYKDDVHLLSRPWFLVMAGINGDRLAGCTSRE